MSEKHLNITIISHSYPSEEFPSWGVFVQDQAIWLSLKINVQVIAPKPKTFFFLYFRKKWYDYSHIPYVSWIKGIKIIRPSYLSFPQKIFINNLGKRFSRAVLSAIKDKPDIFHVHFAYPDANVIPTLKSRYPSVPIILSVHGSDWYGNIVDDKIKEQMIENLQKSDRIITVSNKLKHDISELYPDLNQKIQVIPNGIEIKNREKTLPDIITFRHQNKVKILVVASYIECKGIDILLESMNFLSTIDYEMIVIGRNISPQYFKYLTELKNRLGLDQKIEFKTVMERKYLYNYYKECDFFILPSLKEGFGIVLIEALSFGKPVVSTRSGGPEDIVNDKNGLLVDPGKSDDLSLAINKMYSTYKNYNPNDISTEILNKFSSESIRDQLLYIYDELLGAL